MRVIIFSRVSTSIQDNQRQIDELTEYSQKMNFNVIKVFEEKISGGKKKWRTTNPIGDDPICKGQSNR